MKIQNRNRAMLMAVVGGYVIYLAYEIIRDGLAGKSTMPMWLSILCAVLMGVINQGMNMVGVDSNLQKVVKGLVLLGAVVFDVLSKRQKR